MFDFTILIGRFQPFHKAHHQLLKQAFELCRTPIVVIGSANKAQDSKNPWTSEDRESMIRSCLSKDENSNILFIHLNDYPYNDNFWKENLKQKIDKTIKQHWGNLGQEQFTPIQDIKVGLLGHKHDSSSFYLDLFPEWELINVHNIDEIPHATTLREYYFSYDNVLKDFLDECVYQFLMDFKKTSEFNRLKNEFDYIYNLKGQWVGSPWSPIFLTVDAVITCGNKVVMSPREHVVGKGLLALPGVFIRDKERIHDALKRAIKEKTSKDFDFEIYRPYEEKIFDHIDRSLRGRIITTCFKISVPNVHKFPGLKWFDIDNLDPKKVFEDHWHIAKYFTDVVRY